MHIIYSCLFFFFNDTATTEIYTLSLHDALPIALVRGTAVDAQLLAYVEPLDAASPRSEEHTSELQSRRELVCRLLLEKKKNSMELHIVGETNDKTRSHYRADTLKLIQLMRVIYVDSYVFFFFY